MSGATSKQEPLAAGSPEASPSSELPLALSDSLPTGHDYGQASRSAASADSAPFSDGERDRDLSKGSQSEMQCSAQTLNDSLEQIERQGRSKPVAEKRLYSLGELGRRGINLDLGSWAELAQDHGLDLAKRIFARLLETQELEIHDPSSETNRRVNNANTQCSNLHMGQYAWHGLGPGPQTIWTISSADKTPSSLAVKVRDLIELNWHTDMTKFGETAWFHLPLENQCTSRSQSAPAGPLGKIWWLTDSPSPIKTPRTSRELTGIKLLVVLAHLYCLSRKSENHQSHGSAEIDDKCLHAVMKGFTDFVLVFANLSNPLQQTLFQDFGEVTCMYLHHHLRHFSPGTTPMPVEGFLFSPDRQAAEVQYFNETDGTKRVLHLEERALSLTLTMLSDCGTFFLLVVADKGVKMTAHGYPYRSFESPSPPFAQGKNKAWSEIHIDPWNSGKRAGIDHFLLSLSVLLEVWHSSWNTTLDELGSTLRFKDQMSHTLDEDRVNDFMFDRSESMDLSRQYFTVLQMLRIASEWIDASVADWEATRQRIVDILVVTQLFGISGYDRGEPLEEQLDEITRLLNGQVKQLRHRIHTKTEEVKSLRDGLFNATSLKEAMRGMELNRAIYMFTAVTVIYTPLSFIAALLALPILNTTTAGDNVHPSVSALVATFVIIPIGTYVVCGWVAWHHSSSDASVKRWLQKMMSKPITDSELGEEGQKKRNTSQQTVDV